MQISGARSGLHATPRTGAATHRALGEARAGSGAVALVTSLTASLLASLVAAPARAQEMAPADFPVERFRLATTREGLLDVEWAELPARYAFDLGLWMGYEDDPLVVYQQDEQGREVVGELVASRLAGDLVGSVGLTSYLAVGLDVPLILYQDRPTNNPAAPMGLPSISSAGLGDLRLSPKLALLRQAHHGLSLAVIPTVTLPTASSSEAYFGDDGVTFEPELAASRSQDHGRLRLAVNLGLRLRSATRLANLLIDDEMFARAGVGYRFASRPIELDLTVSAAASLSAPLDRFNQDHLEVLGGGSTTVGPLVLFAAAGFGAQNGFGTPDWRALAGVRFGRLGEPAAAPPPAPPAPEPLAAAAPPRDRDGDGLPDGEDACPDEAGLPEDRGCPPADGDGDGVPDKADRCPSDAEDLDGFTDEDGCPDPDDDGDGVMDQMDQCPRQAGPVPNGGCPDTDRDGDTVIDRLDNCPDEPGSVANRGCAQKQLVEINDGQLVILEPVYFMTAKDIIEARSYKLLDNVAAVLRAQPRLRVQVEGHTDDVGNPVYNKELSRSRAAAVVHYLVAKGVEPARLRSVGYGEERPIADNKTPAGRAANRRVAFVILSEQAVPKAPAAPAAPATPAAPAAPAAPSEGEPPAPAKNSAPGPVPAPAS